MERQDGHALELVMAEEAYPVRAHLLKAQGAFITRLNPRSALGLMSTAAVALLTISTGALRAPRL